MDTMNPTVFVNVELLGGYVGRKIHPVIQVVSEEGKVVVRKSTDEKESVVKGLPPSQLTTFAELKISVSRRSYPAKV